jgi:hypothetical protein
VTGECGKVAGARANIRSRSTSCKQTRLLQSRCQQAYEITAKIIISQCQAAHHDSVYAHNRNIPTCRRLHRCLEGRLRSGTADIKTSGFALQHTHTHTRPHTANHTKNALASSISSEQTSVIIEETQRQSQRTCSHTFAVVVNDANQLISGYPSCRARSMTHCVLEMTQSRQYTLSLTKTWNMARHTAQIPTVSRSTFEQEI